MNCGLVQRVVSDGMAASDDRGVLVVAPGDYANNPRNILLRMALFPCALRPQRPRLPRKDPVLYSKFASHQHRRNQLRWEITLLRPLPARRIGTVFATDEKAALNSAIRHFRMGEADGRDCLRASLDPINSPRKP
jgi:hypothetical protein